MPEASRPLPAPQNDAVPRTIRLDSLTGLRAIAAFAVFLVHIRFVVGGTAHDLLGPFGEQGAMGVTFFFALSGFVLAWGQKLPVPSARFWRNRVARIYPAYLVALLAGVVITVHSRGLSGLPPRLLSCVFLVQSWIPSSSYYLSVNGVSWSLSCEAFFYLCFPLVFTVLRARGLQARRMIGVGLIAAMFVYDAFAGMAHGELGSWLINACPLPRLPEFALGILIAFEVREGTAPRINRTWASLFAIGAWLLGGFASHWLSPYRSTSMPILAFLLVIVAFAQGDIAFGRGGSAERRTWLARPVTVRLGEISFCFYLVHQLVIRCWQYFGETSSWAGAVAVLLACLLLSTVMAWLLNRFVEVPANRLLRGRPSAKPALETLPAP